MPVSSLKLRLSLLITALVALVTLAGGGFVVQQARKDIRDEVHSSMILTGHFLDSQLQALQERTAGRQDLAGRASDQLLDQQQARRLFRLQELRDVRHLTVSFYDSHGERLDSNADEGSRRPRAPAWFVWMVRAAALPTHESRRTVTLDGTALGELVIQPDPTYEIEEIWSTSRGLLLLLLTFFVLVNALVWWSVARALRPLDYVLDALGQIEHGNLEARLPAFDLPEMSRISFGFNHMAETLARSVADNHALTRRLMQLQELERESLARELHDEIGQCVTAIHADAVAIRNRGGAAVQASAQSIVEAIERIKQMVRSILQRLRPGALEGYGLGAALRELTGAFRQRHPQLSCSLRMAEETVGLQGELGITLYRVVQECLTNVSRHSEARSVQIVLEHLAGSEPRLRLTVRDDGRGLDESSIGSGFGLRGMRERIQGLGGSCRIQGSAGHGTTIVAETPAPA